MEKYKKGIKNRVMIGKAYIVILVAFVLLSRFYNQNIGGGGFTGGFIDGFIFGLGALVLYFVYYYSKALKDEKLMREYYIEETDNSNIYIKNKVSSTGYMVVLIVLTLVMLVSIYINKTVFFTLMAVVLFISFLSVFLHIYYKRKIK